MKRLLMLMLVVWKQQFKVYLLAALIGALVGILLLAPSYDYIYAREQSASPLSSVLFVLGELRDMLMGGLSHDDLILMMFYAEIGAVLGLLSLALYSVVHKRLLHVDSLRAELDKDLPSIIRMGEGPRLEFKSSLRWDLGESRVNRNLEQVVLKTLAGFLNSAAGGTLLVGVADDGSVLGLEKDYQTLKKTNRDGFEQALMTAISTNLGADLCTFVHVLFHVVDGLDVCRVIVSPANRPVFVDAGNTPHFFVRTGGATRELNIQQALDYVYSRWRWKK